MRRNPVLRLARLVIVTTALAVPLLVSASAQASTAPASHASLKLNSPSRIVARSQVLPATYYRGVTRGVSTVTTSSSPAVRALMGAAASQACQTITTTVWYNNSLGMTLWDFYQ